MVPDLDEVRNQRFPEFDRWERSADNRTAAQRDRDRVLYSSALRRLTNVTQVAAATEAPLFHNRLTHTLEVAQIARRIAELLAGATPGQPRPDSADLDALGGLDPDVVETAALAHDLGHPPFGHIGEEEIDAAARAIVAEQGFEGNAQSFRIVCRLSLRHTRFAGLNLTRASLNAILKYPWLRRDRPATITRKWGAYDTEVEFFEFARDPCQQWLRPRVAGLEAQIMDWSDDIAYAVHDVEDFYRAGLIPLDRLGAQDGRGERERSAFVSGIFDRHRKPGRHFPYTLDETKLAAAELFRLIHSWGVDGPYDGTMGLRRSLRTMTAELIARYVTQGAQLGTVDQPLRVNTQLRREVDILKQLTWHYVIEGPHLATQQAGQRRIVRDLFEFYHAAISERCWWRLPVGLASFIQEAYASTADERVESVRLAADVVAGLTEHEAVVLHQRITGVSMGPLLGVLRAR